MLSCRRSAWSTITWPAVFAARSLQRHQDCVLRLNFGENESDGEIDAPCHRTAHARLGYGSGSARLFPGNRPDRRRDPGGGAAPDRPRLPGSGAARRSRREQPARGRHHQSPHRTLAREPLPRARPLQARARPGVLRRADRSEEHTSELQSHHDLVCRLLLEKKKKNIVQIHQTKKKKKKKNNTKN